MKRTTFKVSQLASVLASALLLPAVSPAANTFTMTVNGYDANRSTLQNFPVLVRISESIAGFDYEDVAADQSNLLFRDSEGNELPYDVEKWDAAGTSLVWVRVPSLAQGTTITAEFGDDVVRTDASAPTSAWSGYAAVWHFGETITENAGNVPSKDATANGNDLVPFEGFWGDDRPNLAEMVSVPGKVGNGRFNSTFRGRRNGLKAAKSDSLVGLGTAFTVSGWFYANGDSVRYAERLVTAMPGAWELTTGWDNASRIAIVAASGEQQVDLPAGASLNDDWQYLTVSYDGIAASLYCNGVFAGSVEGNAPGAIGDDGFGVGLQPGMNDAAFSGSFDEIRLAPVVRSADWAWADYRTQTAADFLSYSAVSGGTVYEVTPIVEKVADASERGTVGRFMIAIETELNQALNVHYAIGGTAVAGTDYEALSGQAVIPAHARSVAVEVTPKLNLLSADAHTLVLTITEGAYLVGETPSSATLTIANYTPPQKSFTITVNGLDEGVTLTDFPLLVKLTEGAPVGFSYADDFSTLHFTDAQGTVLAHEIDEWNPGGTSLVWVKVPSIRKGDVITAHYLVSPTGEQPAASSVWTGYTAVWHFNEPATAGTAAMTKAHDSTANANHASPTTSAGGGDMSEMVSYEAGAIGRARQNALTCFDYWGGGSKGNYLYAPYTSSMKPGYTLTVSGWWRASAFFGCSRPISHKDNWAGGGWELTLQQGHGTSGAVLYPRGGGGTTQNFAELGEIMNQKWCYLTLVWDWAKLTVFVNGVKASDGAIDTGLDYANIGIAIGSMANGADQCFLGQYDEVRVQPGTVGPEQVKAEYDNVKTADFLSYGAVETIRGKSGIIIIFH